MTNVIYCVYITICSNPILPTFYIGSTSIAKVNNGYHGSVSSRKYKKLWTQIYSSDDLVTNILSIHSTRQEAFAEELRLHQQFNVVKETNFVNMSYAAANGYLGRDMSGTANPMYGKTLSEEHKAKLSAAGKGRTFSEETRAKLSESLKGKTMSEETRAKLSAARKNISEETRAKLSESLKGKTLSEETKAKISAAQKGKKRGPYKKKSPSVSS